MQLYLYEHCPFCVRVLMLIHSKQLDVILTVLSNDDIDTPTRLIGKKMLPILIQDNGEALPESLDIIDYLDGLHEPVLGERSLDTALDAWLNDTYALLRPLVYPRMVQHPFPEFSTASARDYFIRKKFGDAEHMQSLLEQTKQHAEALTEHWLTLADLINTWPKTGLHWHDILLFPVLRNASLYDALAVPGTVHDYMTRLAKETTLPLFHLPTRLG